MFFAAAGFAALTLPVPGASAPAAPARPAPKFLSAQPDQAEGGKILQSFRHVGIQGAYWLRFDLRVLPRRGADRLIRGEMFGTQGAGGPVTKLSVTDPANSGGSHTNRYLLQSGDHAAAWTRNDGQHGIAPRRVEDDEMLESLDGTDLTLFDLQMPFLRWSDYVYEGVANVRGRPAHAVLLYPPAPLAAPVRGGLTPAAIRVFLDTQFNALTQTEWLDATGKPVKTVTVLDLKKTGEQWIVKSIDLRNHVTRDKTRFAVKAIATGLLLPPGMFEPAALARENPPVPTERIEQF